MVNIPIAAPSGNLLQNLVLFGRTLRLAGLDITPDQQIAMVNALDHVNIGLREEFYHALRCLVVNNKDEIPIFDTIFERFWQKSSHFGLLFEFPGSKTSSQPINRSLDGHEGSHRSTVSRLEKIASEPDSGSDDQEPALDVAQIYSAQELLRRKDFAELNPGELVTVKELITQIIWQLGSKRTRRFRPGQGSLIDMRRSYRRNLQNGGEILLWRYRQPKLKPRPLVVIADISGSMERYSNMLLHFVYSLANGLEQPVESFVFSTRLTRITHPLKSKDLNKVTRELSNAIPDWSGGTRIGEALKRFNHDWARRILGHGAVVLLISDGWDRGQPDILQFEIARLQRSCHRLIWLNPLLGSPDYEPLTRGMMAALPFIDDFLPVHNLKSLESLARRLIDIGGSRRVSPGHARRAPIR